MISKAVIFIACILVTVLAGAWSLPPHQGKLPSNITVNVKINNNMNNSVFVQFNPVFDSPFSSAISYELPAFREFTATKTYPLVVTEHRGEIIIDVRHSEENGITKQDICQVSYILPVTEHIPPQAPDKKWIGLDYGLPPLQVKGNCSVQPGSDSYKLNIAISVN